MPGGPAAVGAPVTGTLQWATGYADSSEPASLVLALKSAGNSLWLSAADVRDEGTFMLGLDCVGVSLEPSLRLSTVVDGT